MFNVINAIVTIVLILGMSSLSLAKDIYLTDKVVINNRPDPRIGDYYQQKQGHEAYDFSRKVKAGKAEARRKRQETIEQLFNSKMIKTPLLPGSCAPQNAIEVSACRRIADETPVDHDVVRVISNMPYFASEYMYH